MVCIYCSNKTSVTNSRPQKRLNRTWRRRECSSCHAIFTTQESIDLTGAIVVRSRTQPRPTAFHRDKLFVSILRAVGHRETPLEDADALTATIIALLLKNTTQATLEPAQIVKTSLQVLNRFDAAAAVQYQAYHKL